MRPGTNRARDLDLEERIREEIHAIRERLPYRGDYREQLRAVIETLFFKFGERAGASRLIALLAEDGRSPSTSTAQDEINKFWAHLRENAKVRLDRPDLPDFLTDIFGQVASTVWENALAQAEASLAVFRDESAAQVRDAETRLIEARQAIDRAEEKAAEANARARDADAIREDIAVRLASAEAAQTAAHEEALQWRERSELTERRRAEEAASLQQTIADLRQSSERVEKEQRRLLVVIDDYKTAAARDREARRESEDQNKTLNITMQSMQGSINRLSSERGIFEGRAEAAEEHAERLQLERDAALANAQHATARGDAAAERVTNLEIDLEHLKAENAALRQRIEIDTK